MNILILISSLEIGGAEKQAVIDANLLAEENEVYLGYFKEGVLINKVNPNVKLIRITKSSYIKTAFKLKQIIKVKDIRIIHTSLFAAMIIAGLATLLTKVSVVWHFHSHEYDAAIKSNMAFKILSKFPNVHKIYFVNKELIDDYKKQGYNFPVSKTDVLYNSTDFEIIPEKKTRHTNIVIGYVGRLVSLKRVEMLIELTDFLTKKRITNFEIRIVGDGPERIRLEELMLNNNLTNYFKFLGFRTNIEQIYSEFDIFILPSEEECLSIALIDAGIAGIPSIAFNVGGNNEIILNDKTGFIVNTKDDLFIKAEMLISDNTMRIELGNNAKIHCNNLFRKQIRKEKLNKISASFIS